MWKTIPWRMTSQTKRAADHQKRILWTVYFLRPPQRIAWIPICCAPHTTPQKARLETAQRAPEPEPHLQQTEKTKTSCVLVQRADHPKNIWNSKAFYAKQSSASHKLGRL